MSDRRADDTASKADRGAPPVDEKPYRVIFEGNLCFGAGRCAEISDNWEMELSTGRGRPREYFFTEQQLADNLRAVGACPAKKDVGAIHVVDRRTGEEIAPDPYGDGRVSLGDVRSGGGESP